MRVSAKTSSSRTCSVRLVFLSRRWFGLRITLREQVFGYV